MPFRYSNNANSLNDKTLPGPPVPADHQAVPTWDYHHYLPEQQPYVGGITYQTPPTPTLMAVLGPPKQTSESGLEALERLREGVDSGNGGGNGPSAPIEIPMKSADPLNESCISSLTLGGEGLASGLADTGLGLINNGSGVAPALALAAAAAAAGDSDGEGDGEADFDGKTHRAGSSSMGSHSGGGGGGGVETKLTFKTSSGKKKERLNGTGSGTTESKKSRNKSSAAAKGRVAAWLGRIDPAVPPQEEIIPPSPSVVKDLDRLSFEDEQDKVLSASPNPGSSGFMPITTLTRDTTFLPSPGSVVRRPLLLRDATVIEEARRVQDPWSSTSGISDTLQPGGSTGAISFLPHERIKRKLSPSSSFSKPTGTVPLSYSAVVTSAPPSAPTSSSGAAASTPRNLWKNTDQIQSTSQPKGRQVPPSTTKPPGYKPPGGKLPMFPPSKRPTDPEVNYGSDSLSSSALSKPVRTEKKLFSAAVMTPAPAFKNVRTQTPVASGSGSDGGPKKMTSTPALPVRSVNVLGGKVSANRSTDNVVAVQKRPAPTMNVFQGGGKTTPNANLSTSSSGLPAGKLHELTTTKRGIGGAKATGKPAVMIKTTSDPAVISSSHAVPTLSSSASLVIPHEQNSTGQKQRHHLQHRAAAVKLPALTTPGSGVGGSGSGSRPVFPRPGSPKAPAVVDDDVNNNPSKPAELVFGQARLRDLIKKYQGSSPASGGQKP